MTAITAIAPTDNVGGSRSTLNDNFAALNTSKIEGAINLGSLGEGIFTAKNSIDLQFKKLIAGRGVALAATATGITIYNKSKKYTPADYHGVDGGVYVGDGTTIDTAFDKMMAAIKADGNDKYAVIDLEGYTIRTPNTVHNYYRNLHIEGGFFVGETRPTKAGFLSGAGILQFDQCRGLFLYGSHFDGLCRNKITAIAQTNSTTILITTEEAHAYNAGDYFSIGGIALHAGTPKQQIYTQALNDVWQVTPTSSTTFTITIPSFFTPELTGVNLDKAWCTMKTSSAGGDGLRTRRTGNIKLDGVNIQHINDHAFGYTTSTNTSGDDGSLSVNNQFPIAAADVIVNACTIENAWQTSMTPGGAANIIFDGNIFKHFRGGSPKFASRLRNAAHIIFTNNIVSSPVLAGAGVTPNGLILEGVERFTVADNTIYRPFQGISITPNANATSTTLTRDVAKLGLVHHNFVIDAGYYAGLYAGEMHGMFVSGSSFNDITRAIENIDFKDNFIITPKGYGIAVCPNNTGYTHNITVAGNTILGASLSSISYRLPSGGEHYVNNNKTSRKGNQLQPWTSGVVHKAFDVVGSGGAAYRCTATPNTPSTNTPAGLGTISYADGYTWKWLCSLTELQYGGFESGTKSKKLTCRGNSFNDNPDNSGVDITMVEHVVMESDASRNAAFGFNIGACDNIDFLDNNAQGNALAQVNFGGNKNITFRRNDIDGESNGYSGVSFNNDDNIDFDENYIVNITGSGAAVNASHPRVSNFRMGNNNTFINCTTPLLATFPAIYKPDASFFDIKLDSSLFGVNTAMYLGLGSRIWNGNPSVGNPLLYLTREAGFNTNNRLADVLAAAGLSGRVYYGGNPYTANNGDNDVTGRLPCWRYKSTDGNSTPVFGSTDIPADYFGIPDGSLINSCAHWSQLSTTDFGTDLWQSGQTVAKYDGRIMGKAISAISATSGVITVTSAGHGLTTGDKVTLSRISPSTFNTPFNTVTVVDANTFTMNALSASLSGTGSAGSGTGMVWLYGSYQNLANGTRTTGAGTPNMPKTAGILSGNIYLEFWGYRAVVDRIGVIPNIVEATFTPPTIAAGAAHTQTITVAGLKRKDKVTPTCISGTLSGLFYVADVNEAETGVRLVLFNPTGSNISSGSLTFRLHIEDFIDWANNASA